MPSQTVRCRVCGCPIQPNGAGADPCMRGDLCYVCDRMVQEVQRWLDATRALLRELDRRLGKEDLR